MDVPMKLRLGQVLGSPIDTTTVVVVRAPDADVELTCGGVAMWDPKSSGPAPVGEADPAQLTGTQIGKRYADDQVGIELLCTKPGKGAIAVNGTPLPVMGPKLLPASD
jgi:hypothetical protein